MTKWQPIVGWPHYQISSQGEVRRADGSGVGQWLNDQGYAMVRLSNPRKMQRVHRLVAAAFVPNPDELPAVNHLNHNRSDNHVENLEWCTQAENLAHADAHGRMQRDYWTGKRSPNARLSDEQATEIRREYESGGTSWEKLGRKHGLSKRAVGRIVTGETYV